MIDRQTAINLMLEQAREESKQADHWTTNGYATGIVKHTHGQTCFERAARILSEMPDGVPDNGIDV